MSLGQTRDLVSIFFNVVMKIFMFLPMDGEDKVLWII